MPKAYKNGQNITVRQNVAKKLLINYQKNTLRALNVKNISVLAQFSAYLIMLLGPVPQKRLHCKFNPSFSQILSTVFLSMTR